MGLEAYRLTIRQHTNALFGMEVERMCLLLRNIGRECPCIPRLL